MESQETVSLRIASVADTALARMLRSYEQSRSQSRLLLTISILTGLAGLLIIILSLILSIINRLNIIIAVALVGGTFTSVSAVIFSRLARETSKQENRMTQKLIDIQSSKKVIAFLLESNIDDNTRDRLVEKIILQLIESAAERDEQTEGSSEITLPKNIPSIDGAT